MTCRYVLPLHHNKTTTGNLCCKAAQALPKFGISIRHYRAAAQVMKCETENRSVGGRGTQRVAVENKAVENRNIAGRKCLRE